MKPNIGKGDKGETDVFGKKIKKSSELAELIGRIDHLNSLIGLARSFNRFDDVDRILEDIQNDFFLIGSELAGSDKKIDAERTKKLEGYIIQFESDLKPLSHFIFPTGSQASSLLHVCRSFCRGVEQFAFSLSEKMTISPHILSYLNRLSDVLFVLARVVNKREGIEEKEWKG